MELKLNDCQRLVMKLQLIKTDMENARRQKTKYYRGTCDLLDEVKQFKLI